MINALPIDKDEILLIAHNSDYDCRLFRKSRKCKTDCERC